VARLRGRAIVRRIGIQERRPFPFGRETFASRAPSDSGARGFVPLLVVVVHADPRVAASALRALGVAGLEAAAAADASAARSLAHEGHVDAILSSSDAFPGLAQAFGTALPPLALLARRGESVPAAALRLPLLGSLVVGVDGSVVPADAERLGSAVRDAARRERASAEAAAAEAGAAGLLLVAADGRVESANPAASRLLGSEPPLLAGRLAADLLVPDGGPEEERGFASALSGGPAWDGEVRALRGAGEPVPCRASVAPVGPGRGTVVTLLDVVRRAREEARLCEAVRRLEERARLDPLCGLSNRAHLHDALDREVARARRYGQPLAVLMIDLDRFKEVNDTWGHAAGDEVLRAVAVALAGGVREGDLVARYGGDEFCALLPSTDDEAAAAVADRIRQGLAALRLGPNGSLSIRASVGIAATGGETASAAGSLLLRLADEAMLAAKRAGGDRAVRAEARSARATP
jgi:diguanylate cyclase (GGDEF)-like protein/PAS domain S-box-containing protein